MPGHNCGISQQRGEKRSTRDWHSQFMNTSLDTLLPHVRRVRHWRLFHALVRFVPVTFTADCLFFCVESGKPVGNKGMENGTSPLVGVSRLHSNSMGLSYIHFSHTLRSPRSNVSRLMDIMILLSLFITKWLLSLQANNGNSQSNVGKKGHGIKGVVRGKPL